MSKILLLSDTHSYIDQAILAHAAQADEVWHAGDIGQERVITEIQKVAPLRAVYGNIDDAKIRKIFPKNNEFLCEGMSVLMTHIGGTPSRYATEAQLLIKERKPKIFICGHSHILRIIFDKKNDMLYLNPGAIGTYGAHTVRTMLRFDIENAQIKNMEIIEYPKKI